MKVLHIVSVSFSLKYFIGNQFKYFKEKGVEYTVVCTDSKDLHDYSKEMGFKVIPIEISRKISPFRDFKSIVKLKSIIVKESFDIVIAHSPKGGFIGMIAAYLARSPRKYFFRHGLVFETSSGIKRNVLILVEKLTARCADFVVNVSPSIEKRSNELKLNSPSKNILLGHGTCNGIDVSKFYPKSCIANLETISIGFIGRLSNDKGINELLGAWDILRVEFSNIQLVLVGPFDERDSVSLEARDQILYDPSIKYVGEVQNTSKYYHLMDVFVLPSYREGLPTVSLEASASGLPVVTTRSTGCIDSIIENQTGVFTEITAEAIAEKLRYYILNPDIAKLHGQNGRHFVEKNFSEEHIYKEIKTKILNYPE